MLRGRGHWVVLGIIAVLVRIAYGGDGDPKGIADSGVEEESESAVADPAFNGSPDGGRVPPDVVDEAMRVRNLPVGERVKAISGLFIGLPYLEGGSGEGRGIDADPPARYDVFDCVTFVEEVLALVLAPDPAQAGFYRRQLRYRNGIPTYEARHHFFEAEWIPANVQNGLLKDITAELGPVTVMEKQLTPEVWNRWRRRNLFSFPESRFPKGKLRLPLLDLQQAALAVPRIPGGSLIVTVRVSLAHVPIVVTHVGLTIPDREPRLRHATRMSSLKVRDDRLAWYVDHLSSYTNWPVAGIAVYAPQEQGPRSYSESPLEYAIGAR